ncbi:MAG: DUF4838 domain-containing protein [Ruminococcaceae bacterium]|nr:DUF4838 domain-containing protein [Oscillospiraceae bacterium]
MLKISKTSSHSAVDYAAEELRKYLRMMMPECGNIEIKYDPCAKNGFRLGLMQDFGFDVSDAKEPDLDDILYIDTDTEGGIIAGDNPRSVLLSVYEYLRQNGCRWLMPGVDGEFIPMQDIKPVKYRHVPTSRYRGWCNEGFEYQTSMLEAIDFVAKLGMNVFMMEFFIPAIYYTRQYQHLQNEENRTPEPVSDAQILQWRRQCESEVAKRGLMYHDIGHGWTMQPFGIDTAKGKDTWEENEVAITPEQRQYIAMVNGERKLWIGIPNHTQFCMSNPKAREIIAEYVADYAEKNSHADYIHVWLADGRRNQCECAECVKKIPSDWYMMLLNKIDDALTARNLNTRIVYIAYAETIWAPEVERLNNPKRFAMLFAPSTRKYSEPLAITDENPPIIPYDRNKNMVYKRTNELFWHFKDWTREWTGANLSYEYHFWYHQSRDIGGISLAKIINKDIKFYCNNNIHGVIEDGSQRSFFPTGLAFYTYARTLYDCTLSFEEIAEDYFKTAFGDDWREFYNYLEKISNAFSHEFVSGNRNMGTGRSALYDPSMLDSIKSVKDIVAEGRKLIEKNYNSDCRIRTVSVRLLEFHAKFAEMFADCLAEKVVGNDEEAIALFEKMRVECGKYELQFEPWYDHGQFFEYTKGMIRAKTETGLPDPDAM